MLPKNKRKLELGRETLRSLTLSHSQLGLVAGGISRATECNSKDIRCPDVTNDTLCNASNNGGCPSGIGGTCGSSNSVCG